MKRRRFLLALPAVLAAGCGFKLRQAGELPFATLYIDAAPESGVAQRLRAMVVATRATRLVPTAAEAEVVLRLGGETRSKSILSLSGAGRVTEYRIGLRLTNTVVGKDGRVWAEAETIELQRDMTYDDALLLAKAAEERLLYRDMEDSAALRIMRRLQALQPGGAR
jgi:LPS-assembly lipoprotein